MFSEHYHKQSMNKPTYLFKTENFELIDRKNGIFFLNNFLNIQNSIATIKKKKKKNFFNFFFLISVLFFFSYKFIFFFFLNQKIKKKKKKKKKKI